MLREYNSALTRLCAEINRQAPRPVQVMDFLAAIEDFKDATDIPWEELQQLNVIDIIGDAIIHLCGWPPAMVVDVQEQERLLGAFRGNHTTNSLYQQLLRRFPRAVRRRHLGLYGD